jgi:hypothetical protein
MPRLHQYVGTPVTTWVLNRLFDSHFTDIHCGMRGITRDALLRMGLVSQSWEYASELVLKSVRMGLVTEEVPVTFLKDQEGRLSHHKRSGWFSPFAAAWINLRAMFVHGAEFFLFKPGIAMFVLGMLMVLPLSLGPVTIGSVTFGLYAMLLGVTFCVVGMQSIYFGCLAHVFLDYSGRRAQQWRGLFAYTRTTLVCAGLFGTGLALDAAFVVHWVSSGMRIAHVTAPVNYAAILGLLLMIMGFSTFCFTLLIHATAVRYGRMSQES